MITGNKEEEKSIPRLPLIGPQSQYNINWDEPMWSPMRRYNARRYYRWLKHRGILRVTLHDLLTYYRRPYADYHEHTDENGEHFSLI